MLLRFRFSNFRSFRDENELSLIAGANSETSRVSFPLPGAKESILPACAIYGANASGKSNVLKALQFVEQAVLYSHRRWEPDGPIPLQVFRADSSSGKSEFEIDFLVEEKRYRFEFKATTTEIVEERLSAYPNGRRQEWYSRSGPSEISFGRMLPGDNKTIASLMRKNGLFLSAAAQNNHETLLPLYGWFRKSIHFDLGNMRVPFTTMEMCTEQQRLSQVTDLMNLADLGVVELRVRRPADEDSKKLKLAIDAMMRALEIPERQTNFEAPSVMQLVHRIGGTLVSLDTQDESTGTLAYLSLLGPILRALDSGSVLAIDEIDSSLHPSLLAFLVRLFCDRTSNPKGAQLIFNTHDTNLLADGVLRRDQVWFTEKDRDGVTHLYPLTDFKPRQDENFQKRYLQGRFGAIPFISSERILNGLNVEPQPR